jgi:hypothetical protein
MFSIEEFLKEDRQGKWMYISSVEHAIKFGSKKEADKASRIVGMDKVIREYKSLSREDQCWTAVLATAIDVNYCRRGWIIPAWVLDICVDPPYFGEYPEIDFSFDLLAHVHPCCERHNVFMTVDNFDVM